MLGRRSTWLYYPRLHGDGPQVNGGRAGALAAEIHRAMDQAVPVVYVGS